MQFDHYSIRLLQKEDLYPYFEMVEKNRKRLEEFFTGTVSRTKTLDDTREFLNDISRRREARTYMAYVIVDEKDGGFAGFLDLKNIDWTIPKSEIGCYMDEAYAGKGIANQAFQLFCTYCFEHFGFHKLFLRTHESNIAANKMAVQNGFQQEGILRCDYKTTSGKLIDLIYYGRLNDIN